MSHKASQTTMSLQHANWRPEHHSKRREECLYKQFLNNTSQHLSFSEEVICEMGTISYRKFDFSWLFHTTGPLAPSTTLKKKKKHGKKKRNCYMNTLTQEEGRISLQAPAQNKTSNLLQQRKQHRIPGYGLSPISINVQNHLNKTATVTVKHIEIPQTPRLQDILNPRPGSHVTENAFTQENFSAQHSKKWKLKVVPQDLQALIVSALEDPVKRVQMTSAVCQYAMRTPNTPARDILRNMIKQDPSGTGADSWLAAQCLAIDGDASQAVIQRLLSQHFLRDALSDQEQSMKLLSHISSKTTLVRSLLAEELNSANWRMRVQACTSIAQLKSQINKDVCNKLIHMMWNDWSCAVRHAAALALSKLNVAREMHSELSEKLEEGPTAWRLEALILIGQLKIMTPKLLPTFLQCFKDDYVTVRKQACLTAASLMMEDQSVVDQLINLMQNEPIWEVKVEAINALKKIGWMSPAVQELLMWAVHHEEEPSVRIAACEALSTLDAKGPELQHFLQERYALERNAEVQRHIKDLLKKHGYSLQGDESKIHEIKLQMEQLCTKHIIAQKVLLLEEMGKQQQQNLLY